MAKKFIHSHLLAKADEFEKLAAKQAIVALTSIGDGNAQRARQHLIRCEVWREAAALVKKLEGVCL
jgi:hypothetical protein